MRKPYIMPPEQILKANLRSNAYNKRCRLEAKAFRELVNTVLDPNRPAITKEFVLELAEQIDKAK